MVQDYFKYDKIQGGAPLSIKTDVNTKAMPLGIRSRAEGIKHFTNWDNIANSIDAKSTLRFEDSQPNKLFYKTNRTVANSYNQLITDDGINPWTPKPTAAPAGQETEFTDEWSVEDIKILDDIAVVSYPDYTDIQRTEVGFNVQLVQPTSRTVVGTYSEENTTFSYYGGLCFYTDELPLMHEIFGKGSGYGTAYAHATTNNLETDDPESAYQIHCDNKFYNFENTILRVNISDDSITGQPGRVLYFLYGGASPCNMPAQQGGGDFAFDDFRFSRLSNTQYSTINEFADYAYSWHQFEDGDFAGYFYLITESRGSDSTERSPSGNTHIQLFVNNNVLTEAWGNYTIKYTYSSVGDTTITYGYVPCGNTSQATFIKFTPVRRCGKVELYTKKSGIITAAVDNRITSPGHTLATNYIIKITSALWDGTQSNEGDRHPLNGNKFVKVIDSDTIDLYDDQYFGDPVSTAKLKSTDGIAWVCVGSSNSNEAQSWKYNQTLLSPTGRNGYSSGATNTFSTTTRYNQAYLSGENSQIDIDNNSLYLDFSVFNDYISSDDPLYENNHWGFLRSYDGALLQSNATRFGNIIKDFLDNTPVKNLGVSALDTFNKGPQDFYPFNANNFNDTNSPVYNGTRFGAGIDIKYSHDSGTSKVYTLAISEPGSDVSVDMFGLADSTEYSQDGSIPHWLYTEETLGFRSIGNVFRKRLFPYYMPYGKVHVFSVTVDRYGRISNVSHQNTVFGDGSSLNNNAGNEEHPWATFMDDLVRSYNYTGVDSNTGRRQAQSWSYNDAIDTTYTSATNGSKASFIKMETIAPFFEVLPNNTSLYWDRAGIANWFGPDEYDYFTNENFIPGDKIRSISVTRNYANINGTSILSSRFGDNTGTACIDRFNDSETLTGSQFYVMPWVDSFGKSIAISNTNTSGEISIFGSASVRSNIDYRTVSRDRSGISGTYGDVAMRPVYADNAGVDVDEDDHISQVGQISCVVVDKDSSYNAVQIVEINDGGSVDSSTTPVDAGEVITRINSESNPLTIKLLRTATSLGINDKDTTVRGFRQSAPSLVFEDNHLIWADNILASRKTYLNMFDVDYSNNSFTRSSRIDNNFEDQITTAVAGNGFGNYLSYNNGILLTNALTSTNDANQNISSYVNIDKYDALFVIRADDNGLFNLQKLTPTFSSLNERYTSKLLIDYSDQLLEINNTTYDNNRYRSHTWNMRLAGKYDVASGKIILKDPIEYVLFGKDNSYKDTTIQPVSYPKTINPYFGYTEIFQDDTVYYDYNLSTNNVRARDAALWSVDGLNDLTNTYNITRTPVFFLSLPNQSVDSYGNLTISFTKESIGRTLASYWNLDSFAYTNIQDNTASLVPKLIFYKKDPRTMIVPNGPCWTDTNTSGAASYTDGMYDYTWSTFSTADAQKMQSVATPPLFRGGANDLFHYYSHPRTVPALLDSEVNATYDYAYARTYFNGEKNLGEFFDLTYNQLGNTNKGVITWFANDVRDYYSRVNGISTEIADQYGQIFPNYTNNGNVYSFTVPFSVWSKYVVDNNLIKSASDNRPIFNDSTRIKHGNNGNSIEPSNGTWDYTYDDVNRSSYFASHINSNISLILGFVFTRNNDITPEGIESLDTSNTSYVMRQMFDVTRGRLRWDNRYSYTSLFGKTVVPDSSKNFSDRSEVNNIDFDTTMLNMSFKLRVTTSSKKRYNAKFHKIAYYEYNQEAYSDTQRHLLETNTSDLERYAFGKYSFTPLPVGATRNTNVNNNSVQSVSKNPIIRLGKSNDSTEISSGNSGTFSKSIQVLTSDSVGGTNSIDTSFYAYNDAIHNSLLPSGYSLETAYFSNRAMLGGFDIEEPEALSLHISAIEPAKEFIPLYIKFQQASGELPLAMPVYGVETNDTSLVVKADNKVAQVADLSVAGVVGLNGNTTLYVRNDFITPDTKNMPLNLYGTINPETRAGAYLHIGKEVFNNNSAPLYIQSVYVTPGYTLDSSISTLAISGLPPNGAKRIGTGGNLHITGPDRYVINSGVSLFITTPIPPIGTGGGYLGSGLTTLFIDSNNDAGYGIPSEKNISTFIEGVVGVTGAMPLYIERAFANGISLAIKNQNPTGVMPIAISGAFIASGDMSLTITPPTAKDISLFTRGYIE